MDFYVDNSERQEKGFYLYCGRVEGVRVVCKRFDLGPCFIQFHCQLLPSSRKKKKKEGRKGWKEGRKEGGEKRKEKQKTTLKKFSFGLSERVSTSPTGQDDTVILHLENGFLIPLSSLV